MIINIESDFFIRGREREGAKNKNRDWFHFWTQQYTDNDDTWKKNF